MTQPTVICLRATEAAIMRLLMIRKGSYVLPADLHLCLGNPGTLATMYTKISTLRDAIGRRSVQMSRDYGYRLLRADDGHGNSRDPVDELVRGLTDALAAAKRLQHTRNLESRRR